MFIEEDDDLEILIDEDEDEEEVEEKKEDKEDEKSKSAKEDKEDSEDDFDEDSDDLDEKQKYGKRAEKRIRNLVQKRRELENELSKERESRKALEEDSAKIKVESTQHQEYAVQQYKERLDAESAALKEAWTSAQGEDDSDKLWDIQTKIARVEAGRLNLEQWEREKPEEKKAEETKTAQPTKKIEHDRPDPRASAWASKNSWFGKDQDMTLDAMEIHRELIEDDGVMPSEKGYYVELDKRMREMYPAKFEKPKSQSSVAGGSRRPAKRITKVRLSSTEKATAERMGVSIEKYAREKAALMLDE